MAGPWEKYKRGPWERYAAPSPAQSAASAPPTPQRAPETDSGRLSILDEVARMTGRSDAPAPAPEPASTVDRISNGVGYAARTGANVAAGAREGISNLLGLPVDLMNAAPMLFNLLPGEQGATPFTKDPFGGSASINSLLSGFGAVPEPEATDPFQRTMRRVGQEIGAAGTAAAGPVAAGARLGVEGAKKLSPIARTFVEPAAIDPAKYVAKEMTAATGAGIGAGVANEVYPDSPVADIIGAIGGAGVAGAGAALGRSASDIGRAFFGKGTFQDEVVRDAVMQQIAAAAGIEAKPGTAPDLTPIIDAATRGPRVSDTIPGFKESLADRTKNPGLAALEYSRQGGANAGKYTQQRAANTQAVDNALAPIEPQGTPGQFSGELSLERGRRLADAEVMALNARDAFAKATQNLQPVLTGEGRGANIRTALEDASDTAKAALSEAWAPVDRSRAQVPIDPLAESFGKAREGVPTALQPKIPAAADVPASLVDPENPQTTQALSEVMGVRTALTDELRRPGITPQERRLVDEHIARLDDYLGQNIPEDLLQQYEAARSATVDFNNRFTRPQTAIGQTLATREGMPRGNDANVAQKFVQADEGRVADFEALMREAGTDDRVQSAVRDQILADVKSRGLLEKPQELNDYLGRYGTVFGKFPALKDELGNAGALRSRMDEAATAQKELTQTLTQQGKSNVANYLSYGDEKAGQAMKNVLASRDPAASIDELLAFVNDAPKAVEGARKVFWGIMQEKSRAGGRTTANIDGAQPWAPRALSDFLSNPTNAAVAERLYRSNPKHLERVREIADALKSVDLRNAAKAPNTSGTPQGMSQLLTPEALQSRAYAYVSGRISGTFLVTSIASVLVRRGVRRAQEQGYQRMLDDILTDADTAALVMRENNPANRQALARKAKLWFGNEASTILNAMSADDQDETTGAAQRER